MTRRLQMDAGGVLCLLIVIAAICFSVAAWRLAKVVTAPERAPDSQESCFEFSDRLTLEDPGKNSTAISGDLDAGHWELNSSDCPPDHLLTHADE